jgi:hypothetical protein
MAQSFSFLASTHAIPVQAGVAELDLRMAQLPATAIDYLREVMPREVGEEGEPQFNYDRWLDEIFTDEA